MKTIMIMIASLIVGAAASALAVFCSGAGHGTYLPAKLLFPFTMMSTGYFGSITKSGIIFGMLQFPIYGVVICLGDNKGHGRITLLTIGAAHMLGVVAAFFFTSQNFSN